MDINAPNFLKPTPVPLLTYTPPVETVTISKKIYDELVSDSKVLEAIEGAIGKLRLFQIQEALRS